MNTRQFSAFFSVAFFCCSIQVSEAGAYKFSIDYHAVNDGWSWLPSVPSSFRSASDVNIDLGFDFGRFGLEARHSNLDLNLLRPVEPKDVSLSADKDVVSFFYAISHHQKITLSLSEQKANQQRFSCYNFSNITVGSCEGADFQVDNATEKYSVLKGDLVGISADTSTIGVSFSQQADAKWLDSFSVGFYSTTHDYDWLTPVEDLSSPFILGLEFNGKRLGNAITEAFNKFPQRDEWRLNQINLSGEKSVPIYSNFEAYVISDFVFLNYSDYREVSSPPKYNIKLQAGLRYLTETYLFEFYGNYYHHNLIAFEPITFNQRTEHYFNQPYGDIGIKLEFRFPAS